MTLKDKSCVIPADLKVVQLLEVPSGLSWVWDKNLKSMVRTYKSGQMVIQEKYINLKKLYLFTKDVS